MGTAEAEDKALVRRYLEEVWSGGDPVAVADILSPDYILRSDQRTTIPEAQRGADLQGVQHAIAMYRTAFPDLRIIVERLISEGDMVVAEWTAHATHSGPLRGVPPTGKQVTYTGVCIYRIAGGKIAEEHYFGDRLGLWQQLGLIPDSRQLVQRFES